MIALLAGTVAVRRPDHVIVSCQGVGYRLAVSAQTLGHVPAAGQPVTLHCHLIVREDALTLYGFAGEEERDLFLLLLGVPSVGPKVAIDILSAAPVHDLVRALAAGDAARFQSVKGIGKRTAERIIVELREKVLGDALAGFVGGAAPAEDDPRRLAREGLTGLGYSPEEAEALLRDLDGDSPEALIAGALRGGRR
ncbi:Holliday junction branch migration protein RuvA [Conexibacter sp. DBS9H8]|uniref:Holliday junction branch migration protein RuvA n=1 Tax=Conexibacter sp. DBS9H8 TaxID=2937801 RepID=UPI00200BF551|nr:Holliday junction branch migration protein RuvA [Conexibacter sp. DBS9H8]